VLKDVLKRIRVSQPFNALATATVRGALQALGIESEFVVRHLHRAGVTRCRLPNGRHLKLWSRGDDWVSTQLYWRGLGGYEPETVPSFFALSARATVVLDVGAYVGFYTLLAAQASAAARVYAFEPHPDVFQRLLLNVALNGLPNIECVQAAVGATDGTADFFHVPQGLPTSSSLSLDFMRPHGELHRRTVPLLTMDRFARERGLPPVGLVKIDTESTEPAVLEGMMDILRKDRPPLICEVLPGRGTEGHLEELLGPLDYRFYLLTPGGPARQPKVTGHPAWLNYLFLPGDAGEYLRP